MSDISFAVDVQGFPELRRRIMVLSNDRDKYRETLLILRQIARPAYNAAKRNAPVSKKRHKIRKKWVQPGNLKKSIGFIIAKRDPNPNVQIGPRARGAFDGWYGHFVEEGHLIKSSKQYRADQRETQRRRELARIGKRRYQMWARSSEEGNRTIGQFFMKKSYEETKGPMTADAERQMAKFIQRRINRLSR